MIRAVFAIIVGALLLAALPVLNGRPLYWSDTRAYYVTGEQIAEKLGLSSPGQSLADLAGKQAAPSEDRFKRGLTTAAARSPYYSLYLFMTERIGGLWFVVCVQAAITAWLLFVFTSAAVPGGGLWLYACVIGISASVTTLPLFVGEIMPDFFTGTGVLAAACILLYADRIAGSNQIALVALLIVSAWAHASHIIVIATIAVSGWFVLAAFGIARGRAAALRVSILLAVSVIGITGSVAYAAAVRAIYHEEIGRPPFLMARVLADGPGRSYLASVCSSDPDKYLLCRYRGYRLDNAGAFLWGKDPERDVFAPADNATRSGLGGEERRFVTGTLMFDPTGQVIASMRNFIGQIVSLGVGDILLDHLELTDPEFDVFLRILPNAQACAADPVACGVQKLPMRLLSVVTVLAFALSLLLMLALGLRDLVTKPRACEDQTRAKGLAAIVGLALIANAAVCGALSGPTSRYQTRVAWLVPVAATIFVATRRRAAASAEFRT